MKMYVIEKLYDGRWKPTPNMRTTEKAATALLRMLNERSPDTRRVRAYEPSITTRGTK